MQKLIVSPLGIGLSLYKDGTDGIGDVFTGRLLTERLLLDSNIPYIRIPITEWESKSFLDLINDGELDDEQLASWYVDLYRHFPISSEKFISTYFPRGRSLYKQQRSCSLGFSHNQLPHNVKGSYLLN